MQIHELGTYQGTPGDNDFLAIDNGTETSKIPATNLGVTTEMSQAEAESGTDTTSRVVTPKVFHDSVEAITEELFNTELNVLVLTDTIEELPKTITNAAISDDMVVIKSELGTPSTQTSDWTVTTSNGSLIIAGNMTSSSTTIKLYLAKSR